MNIIHPVFGIAIAVGALALEPALPDWPDAEAAGRTYYVAPSGRDSAPGTLDRPWGTFQNAAGRLAPGDTLYLRGGTYHERVTISVSGTARAPIVFRAYPGEVPVIDSGSPDFRTVGNGDWQPVDAARGEYRSTRKFAAEPTYGYVLGIPRYENERLVLVPYTSEAAFRATSEAYVDGSTPFYVGPGTYFDPSDSRIHVRLAKTEDLRRAEARRGAVFGSDRPDPRNFAIVVTQARTTLKVTGAFLTFVDLTFNPALNTILLAATAHHLVFDGVTVWIGDSGIESEGAHHLLFTRSRIYGDAPPWVFWSDMKDPPAPADRLRSTSIDLRRGTHDVEIARCHIRGSGQDLIGTSDAERDITVHHCRIENAGDDAFELEGVRDVGKIVIHDNYVLNCLTAIAPGQSTPVFTGPLLVYRNVVALLRSPPVNRKAGINAWNGGARFGFEYMFKHGTSAGYTTRNAHYYQNTLVMLGSAGKGLNLIPKDPTQARIANNICVMVNGVVNRDYRTAPGAVVDGNLYWKANPLETGTLLGKQPTVAAFSRATGFEVRGIGATPGRGSDPRFTGFRVATSRPGEGVELSAAAEVPAITDFMLGPGSPAVGAAIAIPPHPGFGALPDSRVSRDLGAIPRNAPASDFADFPFVTTRATSAPRTEKGPLGVR